MCFLSIKLLFADTIIQAICWMLVHSLWQGLLLALLAGSIMLITKRSPAATRYNLLTGAFLLFIVAVVYTFCRQLNIVGERLQPLSAQVISTPVMEGSIPVTGEELNENRVTLLSTVVSFLNEYAATIVLIWFIIMGMRSIRLIGGLYGIYQIKRKQLSSPGEYWCERIPKLSAELGICVPVRFLQSGIAKVPLMLGHFKPVILFPIGLLTSIPPAEVEAILLHELAHIRRRDYLINILQNFIEAFFFFNPAAIWVSSLIKTERENCCDDIALSKASDKRNYIRALVSFQEFNMSRQPLVTALTGRKYHLLQRVKRIIYNNNKTLNAMEKFSLASGLLVAALLALAFSPDSPTHPVKGKIMISSRHATDPGGERTFNLLLVKDTVPPTPIEDTIPVRTDYNGKNVSTLSTTVGGKKYELVIKNDVITELYIDGVRVPDDKIPDHRDETKKILKEAKENWAREMKLAKEAQDIQMLKIKAEQANEVDLLSKLKVEESARLETELGRVKSNQALLQSEQDIQQALLEKIKTEELMVEGGNSKQLLEELKLKLEKSMKLESELSMTKTKELMMHAEEARKHALQLRIEAETSMQLVRQLELEVANYLKQVKKSQLDAQAIESNIINDLIREKVIKDKKDLSFSLNNEELIINGVKQPEALHKKLKEKYVKGEDWNFNYNNKNDRKE